MMPDAGEEICRALTMRASGQGRIHRIVSHGWVSATFAGARHEIAIHVPDDLVESFAAGIEEAQFELRGHFVADIVLTARARLAEETACWIEALTIEAA